MKTSIGFVTPYKHLPVFTEKVNKRFDCIELTDFNTQVDYIFAAPNYIKYKITEKHVRLTRCKGIITPSTGTNHIDVQSVPIFSLKNDEVLDSITSTAEHALYLILAINRLNPPILELSESTLGILGYGRLGKILKKMCTNIFKEVITLDENENKPSFFTNTDFLSINIDLKPENINYINKEFINKFTKKIFIVNTSRGEVVDEKQIVGLLKQGKVLGYGTDVVKEEFTKKNSYLMNKVGKSILITPHIGGTAITAQEKAYNKILNSII